AAGAVTDVVADEICNHGRVSRVIFRDARLDLADEVSADVRGLGVDTAAELREKRDEAGAGGIANDPEPTLRNGRSPSPTREPLKDAVDREHADQSERDDEEAGDGTTPERNCHGRAGALPCGSSRADVALDGHVHTDEAGDTGKDGSDQECDRGNDPARCLVVMLEN